MAARLFTRLAVHARERPYTLWVATHGIVGAVGGAAVLPFMVNNDAERDDDLLAVHLYTAVSFVCGGFFGGGIGLITGAAGPIPYIASTYYLYDKYYKKRV